MNRCLLCLSLCFILSCNNSTSITQETIDSTRSQDNPPDTTASTRERTTSDKIIPGKSIGKIYLGQTPEDLNNILGKPDLSDAAMGKAWMTWAGDRDEHNNKTELNVYVTYSDSTMSGKVVKQIRTTSSAFSTPNGIHVYASLEEIKRKFPDIKDVASYASSNRHFDIYDDKAAGIAFDIVHANGQKICTGITVHTAGDPVIETYIYLQPDVKKVLP